MIVSSLFKKMFFFFKTSYIPKCTYLEKLAKKNKIYSA
ncbi:Hypothetical protein Ccan_10290 [Capnocytophaga canimorsus Cc5]|uniref:Uncharacterized protein n=1 Tax=Capnocytophaga canimorsus (strain 5) TaxID=860228 RepID=F9YVA0_CAPCC|nr:Hypothetical protein Ccan_10290 [Capnocytophaga canimorsus Cc5]